MRRVVMLVAACALLAGGIALAVDDDPGDQPPPQALVQVGDAAVRAEVADDEAALQRGLSGRERLDADAGMLFVLPDDSPSFWMKGMRFALDIVWIKDGRVVDVTADVPPPAGANAALSTYSPARPANRALEVNAGWAARNGVERGDRVRMRRSGGSG
jgi:uncharacterized membrane protein (UPF0127 family)